LDIIDSTFINVHQHFLRKSPAAHFLSGTGGSAPARPSKCGGALATQHRQATAAGSSANSARRTKRSRAPLAAALMERRR